MNSISRRMLRRLSNILIGFSKFTFQVSEKIKPMGEFERQYKLALAEWMQVNGDKTMKQDYALNGNSTVMDLGGFEGQWSSDIFSRYLPNIYVFEPVKEFCVDIQKRFSQNPKIKVYNLGMAGETKSSTIYLSGNRSSTLLRQPGVSTGETIQLMDIKEFLDQNGISKIDLLKINIEGGEYEVLDRLIDCGAIQFIRDVQVQFHRVDSSSETKREKIRSALQRTHKLTYEYFFVWENWTLQNDIP